MNFIDWLTVIGAIGIAYVACIVLADALIRVVRRANGTPLDREIYNARLTDKDELITVLKDKNKVLTKRIHELEKRLVEARTKLIELENKNDV